VQFLEEPTQSWQDSWHKVHDCVTRSWIGAVEGHEE